MRAMGAPARPAPPVTKDLQDLMVPMDRRENKDRLGSLDLEARLVRKAQKA